MVPAPFDKGWDRFRLLDYFDSDLVGSGARFYLDRHLVPFLFYFFTAARNFALRARGLVTNSEGWPTTGFLVSERNSAS